MKGDINPNKTGGGNRIQTKFTQIGGEKMKNKKFKRRKPMAARTVAVDYDHCIDAIAHTLKTLTENEAFKEAAAEAERIRASR